MTRNTNSLVSPKATNQLFLVLLFRRDSEVDGLRRLIYQEGELNRFDFRLLDLVVLNIRQAFRMKLFAQLPS
jgi:hypothetical protein